MAYLTGRRKDSVQNSSCCFNFTMVWIIQLFNAIVKIPFIIFQTMKANEMLLVAEMVCHRCRVVPINYTKKESKSNGHQTKKETIKKQTQHYSPVALNSYWWWHWCWLQDRWQRSWHCACHGYYQKAWQAMNEVPWLSCSHATTWLFLASVKFINTEYIKAWLLWLLNVNSDAFVRKNKIFEHITHI